MRATPCPTRRPTRPRARPPVHRTLLGALAGLGVGGAATFWFVSRQQRALQPKQGEAAGLLDHPALKYGESGPSSTPSVGAMHLLH